MGSTILSSGSMSVKVTVDETAIFGRGGAQFPRIVLLTSWAFSPLNGYRLEFRNLFAQLGASGQPLVDAVPRAFTFNVTNSFEAPHQLEFALNPSQVEAIEVLRGSEAFFPIFLDVQVQVEVIKEANSAFSALLNNGVYIVSGRVPFEVSANTWSKKVAPGVGIGLINVFELPAIALSEVEGYDRAFQAITKAQREFHRGEYDNAVGECRKAIDVLRKQFRGAQSKDAYVLASEFAANVGDATATWLGAMLNATNDASNAPHHSPRSHFGRFEAQMILTTTLSVVAYILRADRAIKEQINPQPRK